MLQQVAKIFGIVFVILGILGFLPGITYHHYLFGIFHVNALHNLINIVAGIIAYAVSRTNWRACQLFFRIFGVIFVLIGFIGFSYGMKPIFGIIANNMAGAWLHIVIGAVSLYFGFLYKKD